MAGLLTPRAATMMVLALREDLPDMPAHIHTHDTAGTCATSIIAAANYGAGVVNAAMYAMYGLNSQLLFGSISTNICGTSTNSGFDYRCLG